MPADFRPPFWLRGGHLQTLWANWAPRPAHLGRFARESTPYDIAVGDDFVRVHWWEDGGPDRPVMIVLHGLTGCARSPQVLGVADKAVRAGFDLARVDLRNASGDTPSRGVGHAGRSEDLLAVIEWVRKRAPGRVLTVAAYSLGGNVALKTAGEAGRALAEEIRALAVISVPVDLDRSSRSIDSAVNRPYRDYFLRRLCRTVERRRARYPDHYTGVDLRGVRTLRAFDDAVVAQQCGFVDASDYYARCSALRTIAGVARPTLLIQSRDDPFIPFESFRDRRLGDNPHIELLPTKQGGHTGFWERRRQPAGDRFWAERRVVEFLRERSC